MFFRWINNYSNNQPNSLKDIMNVVDKIVPTAVADVKGNSLYPSISGKVRFYKINEGVIVFANIQNLPNTPTDIFAFHIHEGKSCMEENGTYKEVEGHLNPKNNSHPMHAGDLPPLFSNNGRALMAVLLNRFSIDEIISKPVIIHLQPDDFTTQPSGNSGKMIACGIIKRNQ